MTKQKILLLNPPFTHPLTRDYLCPHTYKSDYAWPAMDLVAISGILTEQELVYLDAVKEQTTPDQSIKKICALNPSIIFAMVSSISEASDLAFISKLKRALPAKVAVIGDICTFNHERLLPIPEIDYIIRDFTNATAIRGIALGTTTNKLVDFGRQPVFSIGIPRHELFMKYDYYYPYSLYNHVAPVLTSYGCPFKCRFCNAGNFGFTTRDPEEVITELIALKTLGIKEIYFKDFTFLCDKNTPILRQMISNRLNLVFSCNLRVDAVSSDDLRLLKSAGCYLVFFGVESGSPEIRCAMHKDFSQAQLRDVMAATANLGIETLTSFILGFPEETADTIRATERLIFELDPDYLSLNVLVGRHGSVIRNEIPDADQRDLDVSRNRGRETAPGKTMDSVRKEIERKFYLRPLRLLKYARLGIKSWLRVKISSRHLLAMIRRTI